MFRGGNRGNAVPDRAAVEGTLRTVDEKRREFMMRRVEEVAEGVAKATNGSAEAAWGAGGHATLANDPALTERVAPSLTRVVGTERLRLNPRATGAEDVSFLAQRAPGLFFFVGVTPPGVDPRTTPTNHSPRFRVDEAGLLPGLRALLHLAADDTGSGAAWEHRRAPHGLGRCAQAVAGDTVWMASKPSNSGCPTYSGLLPPARWCAMRNASERVHASKSARLRQTVCEA